MGTHGRSGFERLLIGSVAEKYFEKHPVPYCWCHPTRARLMLPN